MELTIEQKRVFNLIKEGRNIVLTGPGGVGKSTLLQHINTARNCNKQNIKSQLTAMTGAAAVIIGGQTLHSYLGVGLAIETPEILVSKIMSRPQILLRWRTIELLIIDEISMLSNKLFSKLSTIAQIIRNNNRPFGGLQLLLSGDFLQLPCIQDDFCFLSNDWESYNFKIIELQQIHRQTDLKFQKCLHNARFGQMTEDDIEYITSNGTLFQEKIPSIKQKIHTTGTGERSTSPEIENHQIQPTEILCCNIDVDDINMRELKKLPTQEEFSYEQEIIRYIHKSIKSSEIDKRLIKRCNAPEIVNIAIGAQVMLLINLDIENGLVNGSRGVVIGFDQYGLPYVQFKNQHRLINFHGYEIKDGAQNLGIIYQIPLKLAYAITIHKSQGLTLDSAIIDLDGVFEYGQAYVALSRVKNIKSLELLNAHPNSFRAHPKAISFYQNMVI